MVIECMISGGVGCDICVPYPDVNPKPEGDQKGGSYFETYIDLSPKHPEQRDNNRSGCWFASLVTIHQKTEKMWVRGKAWQEDPEDGFRIFNLKGANSH